MQNIKELRKQEGRVVKNKLCIDFQKNLQGKKIIFILEAGKENHGFIQPYFYILLIHHSKSQLENILIIPNWGSDWEVTVKGQEVPDGFSFSQRDSSSTKATFQKKPFKSPSRDAEGSSLSNMSTEMMHSCWGNSPFSWNKINMQSS